MKRCPKCNRQYRDESPDVCPDDREALLSKAEFAGADTIEMEPEEMLVRAAEVKKEGQQE